MNLGLPFQNLTTIQLPKLTDVNAEFVIDGGGRYKFTLLSKQSKQKDQKQ